MVKNSKLPLLEMVNVSLLLSDKRNGWFEATPEAEPETEYVLVVQAIATLVTFWVATPEPPDTVQVCPTGCVATVTA